MAQQLSVQSLSLELLNKVLSYSLPSAEFQRYHLNFKFLKPKVGNLWAGENIEPGIYIGIAGKIALLNETGELITTLKPGESFGEFTLFPDKEFQPYEVSTSINSQVCFIRSEVISFWMKQYPTIKEYLLAKAQARYQLLARISKKIKAKTHFLSPPVTELNSKTISKDKSLPAPPTIPIEKQIEKKILVIECDSTNRHLVVKFLKSQGFSTIDVESSFVGIQMAQAEIPDLIICNIMMPQLDGYEVLTKLRQNLMTAIIPVIFITSEANWSNFRKAMELGADNYLIQPFTLDELLKAIATCLQKHITMRQWYGKKFKQLILSSSVHPQASVLEPNSILPSIPKLKEVFDFIEANYHQPITLSDVAQAVGYSPTYLTNLVRFHTGQTVYSWIVQRRIAQAHFLLLNTDEPINKIAAAVGYPDSGHFIRQFRKLHQITPKTWRNMHCN